MPKELQYRDKINRFHLPCSLSALKNLPSAPTTTDSKTLFFIEQRQLMGLGMGYFDAHLLTSTALMGNGFLWSRDKRLAAAAVTLHLGFLESKLN